MNDFTKELIIRPMVELVTGIGSVLLGGRMLLPYFKRHMVWIEPRVMKLTAHAHWAERLLVSIAKMLNVEISADPPPNLGTSSTPAPNLSPDMKDYFEGSSRLGPNDKTPPRK